MKGAACTGEDNGDAHLKRTLVSHKALLPVTDGRLDLGTWQRLFLVELFEPRTRTVDVAVLGE